MKKALFILGELSEGDFDWMLSVGSRLALSPGSVLIHERRPIDTFYIILQGTLRVGVEALENQEIAHLSSGEVVGEMSFLDSRLPAATVQALDNTLVWAIPRQTLGDKLVQDEAFGARFYRAIALFLCDRLRDTLNRLGHIPGAEDDTSCLHDAGLNPDLLNNLDVAKARFAWLQRRIEASSLAAQDEEMLANADMLASEADFSTEEAES